MVVDRAQAVTFLYNIANGKAQKNTSSFVDVAYSVYYAQAVRWAVENEITNGTSGTTFSPTAPCLRGQFVTFIYRFYTK